MLLIGDIHLTRKHKERIIPMIRSYVCDRPIQEVVFMGDFVYHFSYDRSLVIALYHLFVELASEGYDVSVLAGNHDWIANFYIYYEASRAWEMIETGKWSLRFIDRPLREETEEYDILYLPYMSSIGEYIDEGMYETLLPLLPQSEVLRQSPHAGEQLSGQINAYIADRYTQSTKKKKILFHHYYLADSPFPWLKTTFSYKDKAISPIWLQQEDLRIVSGHIHHPWAMSNYLCTWSVRETSPLEHWTYLRLHDIDWVTDSVALTRVDMPVTIHLEDTNISLIDSEWLDSHLTGSMKEKTLHEHSESIYNVSIETCNVAHEDVHIVYHTESSLEIDDEQPRVVVEEELSWVIWSLRIQQKLEAGDIDLSLSLWVDQLHQRFADWKTLLNEYVEKKYPTDIDEYMSILSELEIV